MPRKPNYKFDRMERDRQKAAKKAERLEAKREKAEAKKEAAQDGSDHSGSEGPSNPTPDVIE